ncbi:MAG: energy transducer TonB [Deltaproteobacteria bacterium]|nr:energy transducer TonB [Deltaproteobacteria bacterium]
MAKRKSRGIQADYPGLTGKRIILVAFLASIIIHAGIIVGSPDIFMATGLKAKLSAFKVDLIRPPMDEIQEESEEASAPISHAPTEEAQEAEEATISLDTKEDTYYPYAKLVKERIQQHWTYPASARDNYIQGDLMIIFRLEKNGNLVNSRIIRSSGYQILDGSSLRAIELASPFPPFPDTIPVQFLNINASFTYQLKFED